MTETLSRGSFRASSSHQTALRRYFSASENGWNLGKSAGDLIAYLISETPWTSASEHAGNVGKSTSDLNSYLEYETQTRAGNFQTGRNRQFARDLSYS